MSAPEGAAQPNGGQPNGGRGRGPGGGGRGGSSSGNRGSGPRRGGRGGRFRPRPDSRKPKADQEDDVRRPNLAPPPDDNNEGDQDDGEGAEVCFICANPVAHHSIAPCNHRTCHICGLRMRALYKTKDCAHCRTPAPFVIFSDDGGKRFEEYSDKDISTVDNNIGIKYANEDIVGDTVLLLRYNCPDAGCDFAGHGWPDLHRHVRSVHRKRMCDLCTRNKKVFTHEHELFSERQLDKHIRQGDDRPGAASQTGFKGHPLCAFCDDRFYDDDKLYEHCRMKHERCFLCDRRDARQPHYYLDYHALEEHFRRDHYPCTDAECLEKKFVVFDSELDLQAHRLSEHTGKTAGRDARLVDMSAFDIRQPYQQERRPGRGGGRGQREGEARTTSGGRSRGRGRDAGPAPAEVVAPSSGQPLRRDELAFQRQLAIHTAQSVSNRTFGGQLTAPTQSSRPTSPSRRPGGSSSAARPEIEGPAQATQSPAVSGLDTGASNEERARLVRHSAVIERASNLLGNDGNRITAFRDHISSYRRGSLTAPQLIDSLLTLFADVSATSLGTLVRELADLFEDKSKGDELRKAWHDWRAINEDYPSLPGLAGMQGETSSSSGWADAAAANPAAPNAAPSQRHSTRVLRLKNSTRLAGPSPSSGGPPGWAPAAPTAVASSSSPSHSFPSLPGAGTSTAGASSSRSSWFGATASSTSRRPTTVHGPKSATRPTTTTSAMAAAGTASTDQDAFPALPAAPKPTTTLFGYGSSGRGVRRDFGQADSTFRWGSSRPGSSSGPDEQAPDAEADLSPAAKTKGKKAARKNKTVLVQWG